MKTLIDDKQPYCCGAVPFPTLNLSQNILLIFGGFHFWAVFHEPLPH